MLQATRNLLDENRAKDALRTLIIRCELNLLLLRHDLDLIGHLGVGEPHADGAVLSESPAVDPEISRQGKRMLRSDRDRCHVAKCIHFNRGRCLLRLVESSTNAELAILVAAHRVD